MDGFQGKTTGKGGLTYPWGEDTPDTGETLEIVPGLHWVRMPLPFSLKFINLWLIDDGESWTIIDTGMPLDDTKTAWRKIFAEKLDGKPVTRVIVTHMHPDHVGNAGWLTRKFPGAELFMSRLEYISCRMLVADTGREVPQAGTEFYRRAGWSDSELELYKTRFGGFGRGVSRMPDRYKRLSDGDTIDLGGETWSVMIGRGHSPEHACLYCPSRNILISGDQILPRISSNISVFPTEPDANPLAEWLESCERLREDLPEDVLVLPAHNEPFRGAHRRLTHLIDGHEVALTRLLRKLKTPQRVVDTFTSLFARKIEGDTIGMATGEAVAHLNLLMARGLVKRTTGEDGVDRYVAN
ncbi:MAG: MBL fold metallo-hydrolase [Pseudomonadota bacterium]